MLSIYKASAGSGKTFALTREYIRMLLSDNMHNDTRLPHSRILAVTFTKKSTAEMKERILKELYILAQTPDKSDYINDYLADSSIGLNKDDIQRRAQLLLVGILQDYNRFSVSTIDGFFQQVIRTFAIELGLYTNYDLALDQTEIINQAVDDIFRRIREIKPDDQELFTWLIEYAQKNIEQNKNWNPIGSIKTFSGELSKERLMQQMSAVQEIFANKEAMRTYQDNLEDMRKQVISQIQDMIDQIKNVISNFDENDLNSKAIGIFSKTAEDILKTGLNSTLIKILNNDGAIYKKTGKSKIEKEELQHKCDTQLLPLIAQLHEMLNGDLAYNYFTANAILDKLYSLGILQDVAAQIDTTNRQLGRLPISEINQLIYQIIDGQEAPFIYERIGQHYNHYMIDEFQDTSSLQWQNFKPLIQETQSRGKDNLIVGDVKQSIYRFRNSDWHLLNQVSDEIQETNFAEGMGCNWRTAKEIVLENEKLMQAYAQWVVKKLTNDYPTIDSQQIEDIAHMYSHPEMHQEPKKLYQGYFHMQFFDSKGFQDCALEALVQQIKALQEEKIDLSRITILTRFSREAELLAQHLIQNNFAVQSSEGLRIGSHTAVQIIIQLLKLSLEEEDATKIYLRDSVENIEQYAECIKEARHLSLYDHVQALVDGLKLHEREGATPYLTAFQDMVFNFTQRKVADTLLFLKHWEQKEKKATIPAPKTSNAINIMTIHSSKGLEFDIVMIPFFNWSLAASHRNDIIWCSPTAAPFNMLPLVPVRPTNTLLRSHLANDYIQEELALYTDNLNLTYVAITRPKYRLYLYAPKYTINSKKEIVTNNVGQLISFLYEDQLDDLFTYSSNKSNDVHPIELPPQKKDCVQTQASQYASIPLKNRLVISTHSEPSFSNDTTFDTIDLGNLMHLWLSYIKTWDDADSALRRLVINQEVSPSQAKEMKKQFISLQTLIKKYNHEDWFSNQYQILSEQEIISPDNKIYRPDRVMIKDKHAIVIDYKFGKEQRPSYQEQVRDYMLQLRQLGYTSEGYIIYNQIQTIQIVH